MDGRDTIAAVATASGPAGVGIVRLSGPAAVAIAARVCGRAEAALGDRHAVHAVVRDAAGARVDDVLCLVMRGPRSFTGEDVAELQGHGGALNLAALLRVVIAAGARLAEPGEFSRRALASGRLDLTRAEALLGVIEAASERGLRAAQAGLGGALEGEIRGLRAAAFALLAEVEAGIDFPEEGLAPADAECWRAEAERLAGRAGALAESFRVGRALREGIVVALCGEVNAGKSSLFNRLVGRERALVAAEPGTTRDYVEAELVWDGISVTLVDTAGARTGASAVEARGIELGAARAREADLEVWLVAPASWPGAVAPSPRRLVVMSQVDRAAARPTDARVTSAVTGEGCAELCAAVLERVVGRDQGEASAVVTSERQRGLLAGAAAALSRAAAAVAVRPDEVLAIELREGAGALAAVLGEGVADEVLDALFARFCIGK